MGSRTFSGLFLEVESQSYTIRSSKKHSRIPLDKWTILADGCNNLLKRQPQEYQEEFP